VRIAVFGNTNNYPLRLVQALRKLRHDAFLLVDRPELLHRPESLNADYASGYPDWIIDCSDVLESDYVGPSPKISRILSLLESADALILNSVGPSLLPYVERPSIAFLTGSDLNYYANFSTLSSRAANYAMDYRRSAAARLDRRLWAAFIQRQREGILKSRAVSYFPKGMFPGDDQLLEDIGVQDQQRIFLYMCADNLPVAREKCSGSRTSAATTLFCGTRLTWKKPMPPGVSALDYKGTDVMIHGVAQFLSRGNTNFELRIVEKGLHVSETRELVEMLGLSERVTWLQEMPLREFYLELSDADICMEQLGESTLGMVGLDAMAMGKPVIANIHPDIWANHISEEWPIAQASEPQHVCQHLEVLSGNPARRAELGEKARDFIQRHFSPKANARKCLRVFSDTR